MQNRLRPLVLTAVTSALALALGILAYVSRDVTQSKYVMFGRGMRTDAPPVAAGEAGWLLLVVKLAAAAATAKIVDLSCPQAAADRW